MPKIHPTAIVDSAAELHDSVEVGPYSIIDGHVKIGEGTIVSSHVRIYAHAVIGKRNRIYHGVVLNGDPQDYGFKPGDPCYTVVGDDNLIREDFNCSGSADPGHPTRIGNHNMMMCDTHIGHDVQWGDHSVLVPGGIVAGHAEIGSYAIIGGGTAVHQHNRVGDYAMVGGMTGVRKDVPPYSLAEGADHFTWKGLNVIGLKRAGFTPDERKRLKDFYNKIYRSGKGMGTAVKELAEDPSLNERERMIIKFFQDSKRGMIPPH